MLGGLREGERVDDGECDDDEDGGGVGSGLWLVVRVGTGKRGKR